MLNLGAWFEMRQQNFVFCKPKLANFSVFDLESIVVVNAIYHLSISLSVLEIYAIKFYSCPKTRKLLMFW